MIQFYSPLALSKIMLHFTLPILYSDSLLLFLESETNSITWLINIKSMPYIYTILNGTSTTINMTIPGFNSSNEA